MYDPIDLAALLDEMDTHGGVQRAIFLMDSLVKPSVTARKFVDAHPPDRFALAMGGVNLLRPIPALRELAAIAADLPVVYAVVGPSFFWGDGQYPPSDAVYYPLYTKCAELELPLCVNTGLPGGPPIPGEVQNPIHLDRVCVRFPPELKLCMIHGADPWWDVAIRLLIKYENLRLMTSHGRRNACRRACCTSCAPGGARTRSSSHLTSRCCGCSGWCPRPWPWTCLPT